MSLESIPASPIYPRLRLWQGDITRLKVDAIVNAANSQMLGCFIPMHKCIDNAIHSSAGMQLRDECASIMITYRNPEATLIRLNSEYPHGPHETAARTISFTENMEQVVKAML